MRSSGTLTRIPPVCEIASIKELTARKIKFERQESLEVICKGEAMGKFRPDIFVESKIVVEIKAVTHFVHAQGNPLPECNRNAACPLAEFRNIEIRDKTSHCLIFSVFSVCFLPWLFFLVRSHCRNRSGENSRSKKRKSKHRQQWYYTARPE